MDKEIEIVGEEVIYSSLNGAFRMIRRWIKGWHPELGQLLWGLTGKETLIVQESIRPLKTFYVEPLIIDLPPNPPPPSSDKEDICAA